MNKLNQYISDVLSSPRKRMTRHMLLQVLLLAITSSILWSDGERMPGRDLLIVWAVYYAGVNLMVYLNIYVLARKLLFNNRIDAYLLSVAGLVAVLILFIGLLQSMVPDDPSRASTLPPLIGIVSSAAAVGLLFAGTSALVLFGRWITERQRRSELEQLNLQAELRMLRNQINPHFLFNMLNNCYLLVKKQRPEAPEVLNRLGELLRYQMDSASSERVFIRDEVGFLRDLLDLEKIRRDNFRFEIVDQTGPEDIFLPPMILIPFVENAVKHSSDSEAPSFVEICLRRCDRGVIFTCTNSKPARPSPGRGAGGLGLKNIDRRLELMFPGRYELAVDERDTRYMVTLKLEL